MEKSHTKLSVWDRATLFGRNVLICFYELRGEPVEQRWCWATTQGTLNRRRQPTALRNKGGEMWAWKAEEDFREKSRNLSGLVFLKQVFNQVYNIYLYALVKRNSFIQSSTEFCISVAPDFMQTQKQETYLVVKDPSEMQETWVQSLGQEDPLQESSWQPPPYSCLENPTDRGARRATVHSAAELDTTEAT